MVPENVENGIFILASSAEIMKLLRGFDRLIRPKLYWLNLRYFEVFVSLEFVVSNHC